jgi:hypothetical protein
MDTNEEVNVPADDLAEEFKAAIEKSIEVQEKLEQRAEAIRQREQQRRIRENQQVTHDGRPKDSGDMLEALRREHGQDCPDGLRRDIFEGKK